MKKRVFSLILTLVTAFSLTACFGNDNQSSTNQNNKEEVNMKQLEKPINGDFIAEISTSLGDFKVKFLSDVAPKAVENFKTLATKGYYDGVTFHRVIKDFMIQSGDPTGTGRGGQSIWNQGFENEINNNARHYYGALSMANTGQENSNGSQWFVVTAGKDTITDKMLNELKSAGYPEEQIQKYKELGGTPWLDGKHTVFGQVYEGMETVLKIQNVPTNKEDDKPTENVTINKITIAEVNQ